MVDEVGGFVGEAAAVAVDCLDYALGGFLTHLLRNGLDTLDEQSGGVGAFWHFGMTLPHHLEETADKALFVGCVKTGGGAPVTGRAVGHDAQQEGVGITVDVAAHHFEVVTAGFALRPQRLARAAVEGDATFALGLVVCFFVHVAEHEHFQAYVVLYDYGQETIGTLAEIEIAELHGEVELGDERDLFLLLRGLEGSVTAARARGARRESP